jgi:hypothetical protein
VGRLRRGLRVPHLQNPGRLKIDPATFDALALGFKGLRARATPVSPSPAHRHARQRRRHHGAPGGLVSAVRGPREVAHTLEAFRTAVRWLKAEGDV